MCLRIKDPLVQTENVIVAEEEPEVLESLGHDEALLNIVLGCIYVVHITDARVTTSWNAAIFFQCLDVKYTIT